MCPFMLVASNGYTSRHLDVNLTPQQGLPSLAPTSGPLLGQFDPHDGRTRLAFCNVVGQPWIMSPPRLAVRLADERVGAPLQGLSKGPAHGGGSGTGARFGFHSNDELAHTTRLVWLKLESVAAGPWVQKDPRTRRSFNGRHCPSPPSTLLSRPQVRGT